MHFLTRCVEAAYIVKINLLFELEQLQEDSKTAKNWYKKQLSNEILSGNSDALHATAGLQTAKTTNPYT